jgi:hypothetical protein
MERSQSEEIKRGIGYRAVCVEISNRFAALENLDTEDKQRLGNY